MVALGHCSGAAKWMVSWLTYSELGVLLGVSTEAARRRTMRAQWARQPGNNERTLVLLPEDYETDQIDRRPRAM